MTRTTLLLAALLVASCASKKPHRVTDLDSGRVYYTREMRRGLASGKIRLTDARTGEKATVASSKVEEVPEEEFARQIAVGAKVTLPSSQVQKIPEAEYNQGLAK